MFSVFVELAGLRSRARTGIPSGEGGALDQFHGVFDTLLAIHAAMEEELKRARTETRERERVVLQPLLLDMLDCGTDWPPD